MYSIGWWMRESPRQANTCRSTALPQNAVFTSSLIHRDFLYPLYGFISLDFIDLLSTTHIPTEPSLPPQSAHHGSQVLRRRQLQDVGGATPPPPELPRGRGQSPRSKRDGTWNQPGSKQSADYISVARQERDYRVHQVHCQG